MQTGIETIVRAAHQELANAKLLLQQEAERFNQTFVLTEQELDGLNAHMEVHASGAAVELSVKNAEIIFSLRPTAGREVGKDRWELVAFHDNDPLARYVCTYYHGATQSEQARRMRGVRLVDAVGQYLEALRTPVSQDALPPPSSRRRVLEFQRLEDLAVAEDCRQLQQA